MVALAWVTRPVFCLDSKIVERIDMVGPEGTESVMTCHLGKENQFSSTLEALKPALEGRLRFLERSFDFMDVHPHPVRISIIDSLDPLVRVHPSHLILSLQALKSDQVLEKALLLSVLAQKSASQPGSKSTEVILWAEVFSDLALYFDSGSFQIQDPLLSRTIQWKGKKIEWPFALKTPENYCGDPWRSLLHLSECQGGEITESEALVSLRPFLGSSMAAALQTLSVTDRLEWFRDVWRHWPELQVQKYFYGSSVGKADQQQLADGARLIENWMRNLRLWKARSPAWSQLLSAMEREIQIRGFRDKPTPIKADLIVIDGDHDSDDVLKSLHEASVLTSQRTVLYFKDDEARLLPDLKPFPRSWLGRVEARQAILLQCSVPSIEKLKSYSEHVQKLMLIRSCASPLVVSWNQILQGGIESFIRDNPEVPYIQFDLPSLRSALARKNLNPIPLLNDGQWTGPFFQEIGWASPTWDQSLKAYRSRAAIDAIESFRLEIPKEKSTL